MSPYRTTKLYVEGLEDRAVPSATFVEPPLGASIVSYPLHHHPLHGAGSGTFVDKTLVPDAGVSDHLTGTATLGGRGTFTVRGNVHGVGLIAHGHAYGDLVLTGAHGTITVALDGPPQTSFAPLPGHFHYTVVSGTGSYAHLHGMGQVTFTQTPATTTPGQPAHGTFTIAFS